MTGLALPIPYTWQPGDTGNAAILNGQIRDPVTFLLNPPMFQADQTSGQSVANNTPSVIQLNNLLLDSYGGWNASTWTYTIPVAGWWKADMALQWAGNATGVRYCQLTQNGTASTIAIAQIPASGTGVLTCDISIPVQAAAGDTITMRGNQTSGGSLATQASGGFNSSFALRWIHA